MSAPKDKRHLRYATAARLLSYDAATGVFRWRERPCQAVRAGDRAGALGCDGYWTICIRGRAYKGHRLAWLLSTGKWPRAEIDHINRNRADNRLENLCEVTHGENQTNCGPYRNNKTGYKNVYFHKVTRKYAAVIRRNNKQRYLGLFASVAEANAVVQRELSP